MRQLLPRTRILNKDRIKAEYAESLAFCFARFKCRYAQCQYSNYGGVLAPSNSRKIIGLPRLALLRPPSILS